MKSVYDIIIRPVITEQSMEDLDIKKYVFEVDKHATKIEIKKAVEEIFGVTFVFIFGKTHQLIFIRRTGAWNAHKFRSIDFFDKIGHDRHTLFGANHHQLSVDAVGPRGSFGEETDFINEQITKTFNGEKTIAIDIEK